MVNVERIREEMTFHLSVRDGLSMRDDEKLWGKSAGAARGLLIVDDYIESNDDVTSEEIRELLEERVQRYQNGEPLAVSPNDELEDLLSQGILYGLMRANQIINAEDDTWVDAYGTRGRKE